MIRASHLAPPEESSSFIEISPSPISEISDPDLTNRYAKLRADSAIPEVTKRLSGLAQHSKMKPQVISTQAKPDQTILDLGTETKGDNPHSHPEFRPTRDRPATPHPRDICPRNTEEAN
jgi:hypothetical protein